MNKTAETLDTTRELINGSLENIAMDAKLLMERYWEDVNTRQAGRDIKEWNKLGCRVIKRQSTGGISLRLVWYSNRFFKSKAKTKDWMVRSTEIKPNAKTGEYNVDELKKHAQDWSHELVEATEYELSKLRKQVQLLGKLRRSVSRAITELEKLERAQLI